MLRKIDTYKALLDKHEQLTTTATTTTTTSTTTTQEWEDCQPSDVLSGTRQLRVQQDTVSLNTAIPGFAGRNQYRAIAHKGRLLLVGGRTGDDTSQHFDEIWASDNRGKNWTLLTDNPGWQGRIQFGLCGNDNVLRILGGSGCSGRGLFNDIWTSRDGGATWTRESSVLPDHTAYLSCAMLSDERVMLPGGCFHNVMSCTDRHCDYAQTNYIVDVATGSSTTVSASPYSRKGRVNSIILHGSSRTFFFGGNQAGGSWPNMGDLWESANQGDSFGKNSVPWQEVDVGNQQVALWDDEYVVSSGQFGLHLRTPITGEWTEILDNGGTRIVHWGVVVVDSSTLAFFENDQLHTLTLQCKTS